MFSTTRCSILRQARLQTQSLRPTPRSRQILLNRLLSTLAILEQREGQLQNASLSAVTAAQKLGGSITGFIAGSKVRSVAEEAAKVNGLEKIIVVENGSYDKVINHTQAFYCHSSDFNLYAHISQLGPPRELRTPTCREYQKGRLHPHNRGSLSIRQEPNASCRCSSRHPTNI